ncbi:MAG: NAD(P)/FAD-dependent oxidoreductase [Dermatophilaceae bacterium]|nr:NAD(P)/FAD-dependent oxidoreductase [Dermatophilaceae bacterium]
MTQNAEQGRGADRRHRDVALRDRRHQVVVIGSGFGGLFTTQALKHAEVDVTMIARTNHHLFQPLLYQVATGILSEGEIAPSTREILRRQGNARVLLGEVTDIDLTARTVTSKVLDQTGVMKYDSLVVAAGSGQSYFGNDHFAYFAPGMKSIDDALELRGRIFGCFELAELVEDDAQRARLMTFVVVGAGPTGVEMAGQIAELAHRTLRHEFRRIDPRSATVILLDAAPAVLGSFGDRLGAKALAKLSRIGVEVQLGAKVVGVDGTGLDVEDAQGQRRRIESVCKVWAAGVQASALGALLARQCGAELDRAGRIRVRPDLTLPGHPEVFVLGDMIALDDLPGVAQVAVQGGRHAAREIRARLAEKSAGARPAETSAVDGVAADRVGPAFEYHDKGSMATISRFSAVASVGRLRLSGLTAWLMWLAVHLIYLIGFKHRVTTLLHWAVSFVGRGRSERTVTHQQIFARQAFDQLGDEFSPTLSPRPGQDPPS